MPTSNRRAKPVVLLALVLAGCGGGGGGGGGGSNPSAPQTFAVGGNVSGLESGGLVLQNNAGPELAISTNGAFSFPTQLASGSAYAVTIKTQPSIGAAQVCSVTNGSGSVGSTSVTNVSITCVSRVFKFLYTTSTTTDDLRGYSIDAATGALTALPGPPIQPGLDPAVPIAHPSGRFLYVATRGDQVSVRPKLAVYAIDNATGALTELANSPYDLATPSAPINPLIAQPPAIHPSGLFGYLPVPYSTTTLLFGASIDATTGELTQIPATPIDMGGFVGPIIYESTGAFAFMPGPSGAGEIRSFRVNIPSGVLTPIGSFPTGGNTPVATLASSDTYLLVVNLNAFNLTVFAVDKSAGTLTPVTAPVSTGAAPGAPPVGIHFNRRNNVFYVPHFESAVLPNTAGSIATFRLDPANGAVTPVGTPVSTSAPGSGSFTALDVSGRFLFQSGASAIRRFKLDVNTGAPTLAPDVTPVPGVRTFALDVSGKFLYTTGPGTETLSSYSIDATTGALTLINSVPTSPGVSRIATVLVQ